MEALTIVRDQDGPPGRFLKLADVPCPRLHAEDGGRVLVAVLATGPTQYQFCQSGTAVPVFGPGDASTIHIRAATVWGSWSMPGRP